MKRKTTTKLTNCEEKALVTLEAKRIKEKEAKAKKREKNKRQKLVTLGGQQLPAPQPITPDVPPVNFRPEIPGPVEQVARGVASTLADQAATLAITYALLNSGQLANRGRRIRRGGIARRGGRGGFRGGGGGGGGGGDDDEDGGGGGGLRGRAGRGLFRGFGGNPGRRLGRGGELPGFGQLLRRLNPFAAPPAPAQRPHVIPGENRGVNQEIDAANLVGGIRRIDALREVGRVIAEGVSEVGGSLYNAGAFVAAPVVNVAGAAVQGVSSLVDEFKENRARKKEAKRQKRLQAMANIGLNDLNDIANESESVASRLNNMSQQSDPSIPANQHYNHNLIVHDFSGTGFETPGPSRDQIQRSNDALIKKLDLFREDDEDETNDDEGMPLLRNQNVQRNPNIEMITPVKSRFATFSINSRTPYAAIKAEGGGDPISKDKFIQHLMNSSEESNKELFNRFQEEQPKTMRYPFINAPLVKLNKLYGLNEHGVVVHLGVPSMVHPDYPRIGTPGSPAARRLSYRNRKYTNAEVLAYFTDEANKDYAKKFYKKIKSNALKPLYGRHLIYRAINDENPLIRLNRQFALNHHGRVEVNPENDISRTPDYSGMGSSSSSSSTSRTIKREEGPSDDFQNSYIASLMGGMFGASASSSRASSSIAPEAAVSEESAASELSPLLEEFMSVGGKLL
jgi:hypothetical protein